ncbi:hypothetical protein K504DRAFT_509006 [Pleomassaria siparia CBS 279.74]|uniref:Uncharacterized protein n=1 Tax=Pleomassaria siparia CBS 279.74 TaxID=1314801 RepID=A0A6G1JQ67_9PLEO|nr:hypothetical protein K504DRAFT_509006 [Pleomassaria siparia CBS 279.74]
MPYSKYYTSPQPLCLGITIGSISNLQLDELEEEIVEWVRFSSIKVPVVNKEATNTLTWTLPPIPPIDPYHSLAFFAEYNFKIKDGAWQSEIVQWNKRDTVVIGTNASGEEL